MRLTVATYNVHSGVGMDRQFDPRRIAAVIRDTGADVVALQELEFGAGESMLDVIAGATGFMAIAGPTFERADGAFGNGIVSRWPITASEHVDLAVSGREPRRAVDAVIAAPDGTFRFVATHFGLQRAERVMQATRLIARLAQPFHQPTILAGDVNEWLAPRRALNLLNAHFGQSTSIATFPSPFPLVALDRIWVSPAAAHVRTFAFRSRLATLASDHLPLIAQIEL